MDQLVNVVPVAGGGPMAEATGRNRGSGAEPPLHSIILAKVALGRKRGLTDTGIK
jgi:hypothetical protein